MDFSQFEAHQEYKDQVIAFTKENLQDDVVERDLKNQFPLDFWQACADFGIQRLTIPKQYGGESEEVDLLKAVKALEGIGYATKDNGLHFALSIQMWTVQLPIIHFGTESQKRKFLPPFASGKWIGAHALSEAEVGSDVYSMQMKAEKVEGGYLLNGEKCFISLAPIADVMLVFANLKPKLGKWGICAFLVEKGSQGFTANPNIPKMGLRTVPIGTITFKDCFVPEENRLGAEGAGFSISSYSLDYDRCFVMTGQIGAMERQLEESINYVKQRKQYNQPIGKFQSVSRRIVEMKMRLDIAKLLLYRLVWLKQRNKSTYLESAQLKLHLSESFVASSFDAIRNHGGKGYLSEHEVERDLRDAIGGTIYAGTSDIQYNIMAKMLGL